VLLYLFLYGDKIDYRSCSVKRTDLCDAIYISQYYLF